jgi:hypothetical protein
MICLRCGYCCHNYLVTIIDDPEKDLSEDNVTVHEGDGPCKHLEGNTPGGYSCKVHSKPWYNETPCFNHGQVESSPNDECRTGKYILTHKSISLYKSLERNEE